VGIEVIDESIKNGYLCQVRKELAGFSRQIGAYEISKEMHSKGNEEARDDRSVPIQERVASHVQQMLTKGCY
jgi:hypothetical protein